MSTTRILISLWAWFSMCAVSIVGVTLQFALAPFVLPFDRNRRLLGRFFRLVSVTCVKVNPLWRFAVHGPLPKSINGNTVVVSNHVSNADSMLISHLPYEMKWLAKASLFRVPFLGWGMWLAGDIAVQRGGRDSVNHAMNRCAQYLQAGMPVFIFPEGTRSPDGTMLPFKEGAFRLAIEQGADILPLAVAGTHQAMPKNAWLMGRATGRVTMGTPIATRGMTLDDIESLKAQVRAQIQQLQATLTP